MNERECVGCDNKLVTTKYFCSMECADNFRLSADRALKQQQEEEISYIRAICYGRQKSARKLYRSIDPEWGWGKLKIPELLCERGFWAKVLKTLPYPLVTYVLVTYVTWQSDMLFLSLSIMSLGNCHVNSVTLPLLVALWLALNGTLSLILLGRQSRRSR